MSVKRLSSFATTIKNFIIPHINKSNWTKNLIIRIIIETNNKKEENKIKKRTFRSRITEQKKKKYSNNENNIDFKMYDNYQKIKIFIINFAKSTIFHFRT